MTAMNSAPLVVEDAYEVRDHGLVIAPFLPHQPSRSVRVRYESPDGAGGIVNGRIERTVGRVWAPGHLLPPHQAALVIDVPNGHIPVGTRIWIIEE